MSALRSGLRGLMGWLIVSGLATPTASGDSWDTIARRIASDVRAGVRVDQAIVTHVDPDGRRVYFSGFSPPAPETGATVLFYRRNDTDMIPLGVGHIEGAQGILNWAIVETDLGARLRPDHVVRLEPALSGIAVTPFHFETGDPPASRILRRLIGHYLREEGIEPKFVEADRDEWDSTGMPASALVARIPRGSLLMGGVIRDSRPGEMVLRVAVYDVPSIYKRLDREYRMEVPNEMDLIEEVGSPLPNSAASAGRDMPKAPSGVLRLTLSTEPTGPDGGPAWPPRTPADWALINAVGTKETDTGVYRMDTSSSTLIVLSRRAPGREAWSPETVVLTIDTDAKSRLARFELGESDIHVMSDAEFLKFTTSTAYINRIASSGGQTLMALVFRLSRPVVGDMSFRKAVWHAFDRRATLDVLLNNRGTLARGFLPPKKSAPTRPAPRDAARSVARARNLWNGNPKKPVRIGVLIPEEEPVYSLVAERVQADLKAIGAHVAIERVSWPVYAERLESGMFDMALASWPQAEAGRLWLTHQFRSSSSANICAYVNPAFDALSSEPEAFAEANEILIMDMPAIPLFWLTTYAVLGERVLSASFDGEPALSLDGIRLAR